MAKIGSCRCSHEVLVQLFQNELVCAGLQEAKEKLLQLVDLVRELDMEVGGGHTCAADILTLYAHTEVWFIAERNYKVSICAALVCLTFAALLKVLLVAHAQEGFRNEGVELGWQKRWEWSCSGSTTSGVCVCVNTTVSVCLSVRAGVCACGVHMCINKLWFFPKHGVRPASQDREREGGIVVPSRRFTK